jgi:hypothetical protein
MWSNFTGNGCICLHWIIPQINLRQNMIESFSCDIMLTENHSFLWFRKFCLLIWVSQGFSNYAPWHDIMSCQNLQVYLVLRHITFTLHKRCRGRKSLRNTGNKSICRLLTMRCTWSSLTFYWYLQNSRTLCASWAVGALTDS